MGLDFSELGDGNFANRTQIQKSSGGLRTMRFMKIALLAVLSVFVSQGIPELSVSQESSEETGSLGYLLSVGDSIFADNDYAASAQFYEKAAGADSTNFDAFWKLGRSLNLMGETAAKDSQLAIFEKARNAEVRAVAINDYSADAHFQLARAVGKIALFKGVFKSIGLAKRSKREAERALALDSLHDGAWHVLGRWHREVGKKPKIVRAPMGLGAANREDAISFMEKAIAINPANIQHHLEMGITYREYEKIDQARREFETCLSLPVRRPLDYKYVEEAKKCLAEIKQK
jgi:tetratricopeptide (TPR) repeat protein